MKNLIIYLIAIMFSGSIALQKNDTPKVTPYKVAVETADGKRFYIPNNLVDIKQEAFENWYGSPYRGRLEIIIGF